MGATIVEPDEKGYGYAYRYAFDRARGEYIVMGDADTTYDFESIPRLLNHLQETNADIVMGSRLNGEIKDGSMPTLHQYIGNPLLTRFLNVFYGAGVSDAHSGFRIMRRDSLERMNLSTDGMEFASEMIMEAGAIDLKIEEVPIVYHERKGEETLDSFRDGWRHVRFMLVNAPGYLFSAPGLVFGLLGITLMAVAYGDLSIGSVTFGLHTMIFGSLLTIMGFQVVSFGILATVAGNPIRNPADPITNWITQHASLERGTTVGLAVFAGGMVYATVLLAQWITNGLGSVSFTLKSLLAFTAIILGGLIVFSSFFMSVLAETR
jgi:glycosyltransferase involved in cell wall biosynthesis